MSNFLPYRIINQVTVELVQGDITKQNTDAIVNAANSSLLGGGGVDGAIHRAGGPSILDECRQIGGCPTGEARITGAGALAARSVIHAVGPNFSGVPDHDAPLLAGAYRSSLELASQHEMRSIAFPSISTGAYRYPVKEAAQIALQTVADYLCQDSRIELVRFVLFDQDTFDAYQQALQQLSQRGGIPGDALDT